MAIKVNAAKLRNKIIKAKIPPESREVFAYKYNNGINAALDILDKLTAKQLNKEVKRAASKPHKVTEVCNWCEKAVTLHWDTKHDGYNIYCPCCGKEMELSDAYYREVTAKEQTDDKES